MLDGFKTIGNAGGISLFKGDCKFNELAA